MEEFEYSQSDWQFPSQPLPSASLPAPAGSSSKDKEQNGSRLVHPKPRGNNDGSRSIHVRSQGSKDGSRSNNRSVSPNVTKSQPAPQSKPTWATATPSSKTRADLDHKERSKNASRQALIASKVLGSDAAPLTPLDMLASSPAPGPPAPAQPAQTKKRKLPTGDSGTPSKKTHRDHAEVESGAKVPERGAGALVPSQSGRTTTPAASRAEQPNRASPSQMNGDSSVASAQGSSLRSNTTEAGPSAVSNPKANDVENDQSGTASASSMGRPMSPEPTPGVPKRKVARRQNRKSKTEAIKLHVRTKEDALNYLATQWITWKEIRDLEALNLVPVVRGRFDIADERVARAHLREFQERRRMSDEDLVMHIHHLRMQHNDTFWSDLAACFPGRPIRAIHPWIKRMYDPRGHQGAWTAEEDETLRSAFERMPNSWAAIGEEVGRPLTHCRDRYRTKIAVPEAKKIRDWTEEDFNNLRSCVETAKQEVELAGGSGIPWTIVADRMGGIGFPDMMRHRWHVQYAVVFEAHFYRLKLQKNHSRGRDVHFSYEQTKRFLNCLKNTQATKANQVAWDELADDGPFDLSGSELRTVWVRLKKILVDHTEKTFQEKIDALLSQVNEECVRLKAAGKSEEDIRKMYRPILDYNKLFREKTPTPAEVEEAERKAEERRAAAPETKEIREEAEARDKGENLKQMLKRKAGDEEVRKAIRQVEKITLRRQLRAVEMAAKGSERDKEGRKANLRVEEEAKRKAEEEAIRNEEEDAKLKAEKKAKRKAERKALRKQSRAEQKAAKASQGSSKSKAVIEDSDAEAEGSL